MLQVFFVCMHVSPRFWPHGAAIILWSTNRCSKFLKNTKISKIWKGICVSNGVLCVVCSFRGVLRVKRFSRWPQPILGASASKLTDMPTHQSAPRLQPRLGLDKVRGLRGGGANPQADSGQVDGVELGARLPGSQLPDASGSQGSKKEAKKAAKAMAT